MKDLALQKPFLQTIETTSPQAKNYYAMRKLIGDYLTKLNVASYDTCCAPSENTSWPTRWSSDWDRIERFDGTEWVEVPTGGVSGFTPTSVIFADGGGNLTDDGTTFSYNTTSNILSVNGINIGRGVNNVATDIVIGTSSRTAVGGQYNVFIGHENYTTGTSSYNVGIGWRALRLGNTSGGGCVAIGGQALYNLQGGTYDTVAVGVNALYTLSTTSIAGKGWNTSVGSQSGFNVTTGEFNTFLGTRAGNNIRLGHHNTIIGQAAMGIINPLGAAYDVSQNTALGSAALYVCSGNGNLALGFSSGSSITTGSYNVILGSNNGASIATSSNNIIISDGQGNIKLTIDSAHIFTLTNGLQDFADDTAAAVGGIPVNGLYRTASAVKIRVV